MSTESMISADLAVVGRTSRARMPSPSTSVTALLGTTKQRPRPVEIAMIDYARVYAARCARIAASGTTLVLVVCLLAHNTVPWTDEAWDSGGTYLVDVFLGWAEVAPLALALTVMGIGAVAYYFAARSAMTRFERGLATAADPRRYARKMATRVDRAAVRWTIAGGAVAGLFFATVILGFRAQDLWELVLPASELRWRGPVAVAGLAHREPAMLVVTAASAMSIVVAVVVSLRVTRAATRPMHFLAVTGAVVGFAAYELRCSPLWDSAAWVVALLSLAAAAMLAVVSGLVLVLRTRELHLLEGSND